MQPKITQISSVWSNELNSIQVIGLGDDNKVYIWNYATNRWEKFAHGL